MKRDADTKLRKLPFFEGSLYCFVKFLFDNWLIDLEFWKLEKDLAIKFNMLY